MSDRTRSKREEREYTRLMISLREQEAWWEEWKYKKKAIPPEWYGLHNATPCQPKKVRVTAGYDADVVRFFRGLGQGYQARMNAVLRAYMHAVLAKEIEGPDDRNSRGDPI